MKTKRIIIIEGADATGKSGLCDHIKLLANGKCHTLHSNYNKDLPGENNYRQHKLMAKFAVDNFKPENYTGNYVVVLDRCYVSDMTYGQIGYGSKGSIEEKYSRLDKLFKALTADKTIEVSFVYCRTEQSAYDINEKEELLNTEENSKMSDIYDSVCLSFDFFDILAKNNIKFYEYNFITDPNYVLFDTEFNYMT